MIKKIRFIAGALLSLFISWLYVDHVIGIARHIDKGFIRILDWFLVCILFHVVFFLLSNLMCVRIGFPKHDGNVGKTVLSWVVFVFGMPVIFVVKLVMFFIQGGFSDIFPTSNEEDDGYENRSAYTPSTAPNGNGRAIGHRDFEYDIERIADSYLAGKGFFTVYGARARIKKVNVDVEWGHSNSCINLDIYFACEATGNYDINDIRRNINEIVQKMHNEMSDYILSARKKYNNLDCSWDINPNVNILDE